MAGFNDAPIVQRLAIPAVTLLIAFLGYTSQWLFRTADELAPGPLTPRQSLIFNLLLASLWWTYFRACTVSPGRYVFPAVADEADKAESDAVTATPDGPLPPTASSSSSDDDDVPKHPTSTSASLPPNADGTPRWCKKCALPKPPRAHHCRHCGRCIPKMDHHCPWTANCVSLTTFPHFLRFLLYANISLWTLAYFIGVRVLALWDDRALPAYLGPSLPALIHLTLLALLCGVTSLALGILLITTAKNWLFNTTSIEGWEIDRHEAQVDRGKHRGEDWWGVVDAQGRKFRLEPVEFPYDLGLFANLAQAMGTRNPLAWFFPLSGNPRLGVGGGVGWDWEDNGLNDRPGMWPPPDPDKMRRATAGGGWPGRGDREDEYAVRYGDGPDGRAAFRARQAADLERRRHRRESPDGSEEDSDASSGEYDYDMVDETYGRQETDMDAARWANAYGERLRDYGVDEEVEASDYGTEPERPGKSIPVPAYDDDDVPLGELLRRRRVVELPDDYEE